MVFFHQWVTQNTFLTSSRDFCFYLLTLFDSCFFCKFSKKSAKKFQSSISPQLRVPKDRTIARLKGLILGFHFGQVSPVAARAFLQNFSLFFRYRRFAAVPYFVRPAARGLVVTTENFWDLLHRSWLCKCMELFFVMGQIFLRKLDFAENGNLGKKDQFCAKKSFFSVLVTFSFFLLIVPFKPI